MIRTDEATVKRLAGGKGVTVVETRETRDGRSFEEYFTVWLGEGHGLNVGDTARFLGRFSKKVAERNGRTYVDVNVNDATVVEGSLVRAQQPDPTAEWATATPGAGDPWEGGQQ
jgi:hypothetical protein